MTRLVMLSGGVASWATGREVARRHGTDDMTLLFTDTHSEDADTYRFLDEAAADIGAPLVKIAEGRDVWEVAFDEGMIPNTRAPICSRVLKAEPARKWVEDHCHPDSTTIYIGLDWTEEARLDSIRRNWLPWVVQSPLRDMPIKHKRDLIAQAEARGLHPPKLYAEGFPHANNGGACFRAGQAQWRLLLRTRPETYAHWEEREGAFREQFGKDVSILRDRTGGTTTPLTLRSFRERMEADGQCDLLDWGGCCDAMGSEAPA